MYTLITPPASEPMTLSEVKAALRIGHDDDDTLLEGMISTARTYVERRLDLALLEQVWSYRHEGPVHHLLPLRPGRVTEVLSVTVTEDDGTATVIDEEDWRLTGSRPEMLDLCLPAGFECPFHTDIQFKAGAATAEDIPADLLRAVYLLTAHYYEERELFRSQRYVSVPLGVESLIETYKEVRL